MKRSVTLLLLSFGLLGAAFAQTTFQVSTNSVWTIAPSGDDDVEGYFVISNPTSTVQTIKWERTIVDITSGCLIQVCDLTLCWLPTVSSKTFDIDPGTNGNIILHFVNHDLIPDASALVNLKLSNNNNPADSVVVTFLYTPETADAKDLLPAATVQLYPNPATDYFLLQQADDVQRIRLFSTDGREVANYTANPGQQYSLAGLANGTYAAVLEDKNGRAFQAISIVKK